PGIARTVVMAREDSPGDVRLIGYAVPHAGQQPDAAALREALRAGLPDYMLPQQIVLLDAMPLLPNGKIDRKALPAPTGPAPSASAGAVKPARNDTEKAVVEAMQAVLKLEQQIGKQISPRRYVSETLAQLAVAYDATGADTPPTTAAANADAAEPAPGLMKRLARLVQRA
ncbi:AMP-binding enzyme, partial [Aeromicrobium sp.]|uniref:AMP-binding enzyme n=1 Tax=Aeromicrobium sp. TaxID=1871063 RepID=UPI004033B668